MSSEIDFEDRIRQTLLRRAEDVQDLDANMIVLGDGDHGRRGIGLRPRILGWAACLLVVVSMAVAIYSQRESTQRIFSPAVPGVVLDVPDSYEVLELANARPFPATDLGADSKLFVLGRRNGAGYSNLATVAVGDVASESRLASGAFSLNSVARIELGTNLDELRVFGLAEPGRPNRAQLLAETVVVRPGPALGLDRVNAEAVDAEVTVVVIEADNMDDGNGAFVMTHPSFEGEQVKVEVSRWTPDLFLARIVADGSASTAEPLSGSTGWSAGLQGYGDDWNAVMWEVHPGNTLMVSGNVEIETLHRVMADLDPVGDWSP